MINHDRSKGRTFFILHLLTRNKILEVVMGEGFSSDGSQEAPNPTTSTQLRVRIAKALNFWSIIEILCLKLVVRTESEGTSKPLISHTLLAQS
jgi:hypothetical protein